MANRKPSRDARDENGNPVYSQRGTRAKGKPPYSTHGMHNLQPVETK